MGIILETTRLVLKAPEASHLAELIALRADPLVMRYVGNGCVQSPEEVAVFLQEAENYFKTYGMGFFSVFEKHSGAFVGQAGLFHLGFDVNQEKVELAYRLHQQYWHKGYATELAKALIPWGFKTLGLTQIIALIYPQNEPSRRVLEKAGLVYQGIIPLREWEYPSYVIKANKLNLSQVKLKPATLADYPCMQNLADYYAYDIAEYLGWPQAKDGTHRIGIDFKKYWETQDCFPYLIQYLSEWAGFVIVDKNVHNLENDFNMAQFFILRQFKAKGLGRHLAYHCFDHFKGKWEVYALCGNEGAYRFWRRIIQDYTQGKFKESTRQVGKVLRNYFEFTSREKTVV